MPRPTLPVPAIPPAECIAKPVLDAIYSSSRLAAVRSRRW